MGTCNIRIGHRAKYSDRSLPSVQEIVNVVGCRGDNLTSYIVYEVTHISLPERGFGLFRMSYSCRENYSGNFGITLNLAQLELISLSKQNRFTPYYQAVRISFPRILDAEGNAEVRANHFLRPRRPGQVPYARSFRLHFGGGLLSSGYSHNMRIVCAPLRLNKQVLGGLRVEARPVSGPFRRVSGYLGLRSTLTGGTSLIDAGTSGDGSESCQNPSEYNIRRCKPVGRFRKLNLPLFVGGFGLFLFCCYPFFVNRNLFFGGQSPVQRGDLSFPWKGIVRVTAFMIGIQYPSSLYWLDCGVSYETQIPRRLGSERKIREASSSSFLRA